MLAMLSLKSELAKLQEHSMTEFKNMPDKKN